jgi:hypothetical protein
VDHDHGRRQRRQLVALLGAKKADSAKQTVGGPSRHTVGVPGILPAVALTIALSSHAAGASPVGIGLRATFEVQCGWVGPRITVIFPTAERLPARFAPGAVLVNGSRPAAVTRSGQTVSLTIPRPTGVMCDSIGPGTVRVDFTRAAQIGNPRRAGLYTVHAEHGTSVATATFALH